MRTHLTASVCLVLLLLCLAAGTAAGDGYSITALRALPGSTVSGASAINAAGQIVGGFWDASSNEHACLWQNGTITDLGTLLGDSDSEAHAINDAGQIVGWSEDVNYNEHACLWQNGTITALGALPGSTVSVAIAINDAGQIVGWSEDASSYEHACLWQNGTITALGALPGSTVSEAYGINDAGQIVGWFWDASSNGHACLWQNGAITDLGTLPGGGDSWASAINDAGQIVVGSLDASSNSHAWLWQNGTITDLGALPGSTSSGALAINDAGQVVGYSSDASSYEHACLWQNGAITDLGMLPGDVGSGADAINDTGQIVGGSSDASGYWHACLWQPATGGPSIDSFTLTPSTLSSTICVTATVTTTNATRVTLSIAGLGVDQPTITMSWNGSAWTAPISGSLAKWAHGNSLTVTATACDDQGHTASATQTLAVDSGQPPPGGTGDPNAIWVDERNGYSIFTGSAQVLNIGPPFSARLSMNTDIDILGQDQPMNLWPGVTHVITSGVSYFEPSPVADVRVGYWLAEYGRCSPVAGPSWDATFTSVNDTASFTASMDWTGAALNIADIIFKDVAPAVAKSAGVDVPDISPSTLLGKIDEFLSFPSVQKASQHFTPWPTVSHLSGAALAASWDLRELITDADEREQLRQLLQDEFRTELSDAAFELTGTDWVKAVGDAIFDILKSLTADVDWAYMTKDGDPRLVYRVLHANTGSTQLVVSSTGLSISSVVGAPSIPLTYDEAETPSGAAYTFAVTNTGSVPVWEFRMELTPSSPEPTALSAPAGWQGEIIWNDTDHYVRWYTQGPSGWASGDFGASVIAQNGALSGFQVTLPQGLAQTTYLTMDTNLQMDAGMLAMIPGLLAAPPDFAPGAGETADLDAYLDRAANAGITVYRDGVPYRTLSAPTSLPAGEFTVIWDGQDQDGKLAPVGDYEAHLDISYADLTATTVTASMLVAFSDVPWDFWAHDQIYAALRAKIVQGYPDDSYQPGTAVTRDQMAVYISRALAGGDAAVSAGPATATFSDVPTDYWAFKYVEYAAAQSVVQGYSDGTYKPADQVDRGQMAVFIARSIYTPTAARMDLTGYTPPTTATFPDVLTNFWAYKYVEYIAQPSIGVTLGYPDGDYHPEYICTRDQMAVYVARAFQLAL